MKKKPPPFTLPYRIVKKEDAMTNCIASMIEDNLSMKRVENRTDLAHGTFIAQPVAWAVELTVTLRDRQRVRDFLDQWFTHDAYYTVQLPEAERIRRERERKARIKADLEALQIEASRLEKMLKPA